MQLTWAEQKYLNVKISFTFLLEKYSILFYI